MSQNNNGNRLRKGKLKGYSSTLPPEVLDKIHATKAFVQDGIKKTSSLLNSGKVKPAIELLEQTVQKANKMWPTYEQIPLIDLK